MKNIKRIFALLVLLSLVISSLSGCSIMIIKYAYETTNDGSVMSYKDLKNLRCDKYDNVKYGGIKYSDSGVSTVGYAYQSEAVGKVVYAVPYLVYEPMFLISQNDFEYRVMEFKGKFYTPGAVVALPSAEDAVICGYTALFPVNEKGAQEVQSVSGLECKLSDILDVDSRISGGEAGVYQICTLTFKVKDTMSFSLGSFAVVSYNGERYMYTDVFGGYCKIKSNG